MDGVRGGSTKPLRGTEVFEAAARRATALVGDGCVIRRAEVGDGAFAAIAADHRDAGRRGVFKALLEAPPLEAPAGWLGQALERGHALRLPDVRPETLVDLGVPSDDRVGDAIVVPVARSGVAIVALRDRVVGPYSAHERRQVEEIAALLGSCLEVGEPDRPQPPGPAVDPECHGLLDVTSAALWMVDARGRTTYVNEAASELAGWPASQLAGVPISEFLGHACGRPRAGFYGTRVCDRPLVRPDGTVTWVTATARPIFDDRGEQSGILHTLVEVGERRRQEVEVRFRLQRKEALLELAEDAAGGAEPEGLAERATAFVTTQLGAELASIVSFDADTHTATAVAASGWPEASLREPSGEPRAHPLPPRSALLAALQGGEPVLVGDYEGQSLFTRPRGLAEAGVRSEAVVPFAAGTMALAAHSTRPGAINGEALSLLESTARLLAPRWARR